ncbi:hypothetical protein F4860DRAFT_123808 [Xylaria cubensis]|nr:hypothetical protein F4860DRAFT_123808 [Xylaria cubensis]
MWSSYAGSPDEDNLSLNWTSLFAHRGLERHMHVAALRRCRVPECFPRTADELESPLIVGLLSLLQCTLRGHFAGPPVFGSWACTSGDLGISHYNIYFYLVKFRGIFGPAYCFQLLAMPNGHPHLVRFIFHFHSEFAIPLQVPSIQKPGNMGRCWCWSDKLDHT